MTNNKITKHATFKRSVYTEIVINAPIEKVWRELTNFKEMPTWSKSLQKIEGDFKKMDKQKFTLWTIKAKWVFINTNSFTLKKENYLVGATHLFWA